MFSYVYLCMWYTQIDLSPHIQYKIELSIQNQSLVLQDNN